MGKSDWKGMAVILFLGVIAAAVVIGLLTMAFGVNIGGNTVTKSIGDSTTTNDKGEQQLLTCDSSTTPDIDINAYDKENPGTALTEATNLYRKNGATAWNTWTAGTAITGLEFGETYDVVMGITTADFTDNAYGSVFSVKIPCKEVTQLDKPMYNDAVETVLVATFYNKNSDAGAQAFTAGQAFEVGLEFQATTDLVFGNPYIKDSGIKSLTSSRAEYPNVLCMDLNSTAWDQPEKVSYQGVELNRVSVPTRHAAVAGKIAYCYEAPIITDSADKIKVKLNADDTTAPAVDDTASLYAANFFVNGDDGQLYWGVETEEGAAVGTDAADTLTLDFTA